MSTTSITVSTFHTNMHTWVEHYTHNTYAHTHTSFYTTTEIQKCSQY